MRPVQESICLRLLIVQIEQQRSKICVDKTKGKYFPIQTAQMRLIKNLLYIWVLASFSSFLTKFCVHELMA